MKILRTKWRNAKSAYGAFKVLLREETTFQVQMVSASLLVVFSFLFNISSIEWLFVILVIGIVFATEALNTAIEELCDHVTPEQHPHIGKIKDLGATASAFVGIAGIVICVLIFIPRILTLI